LRKVLRNDLGRARPRQIPTREANLRTSVTSYDPRFGIARNHWIVFQNTAARMNKIIMVRKGNESAIPWIAKGFPAKPIELKIKVDGQIGLLLATQQDRPSVLNTGHFLVSKSGQDFVVERKSGPPVPLADVAPPLSGACGSSSWAQPGLVLDCDSGLPFTSDYDIGAVIDLDDPRWGRTHLSEPQAGTPNLTSRFVQPIIDRLNSLMMAGTCVSGQKRIPHGTQAQFGQGSPMNAPGETVLLFELNDKVEAFSCRTVEEGREELKNIMRENLPATVVAGGGKVIPLSRKK